jgi:Na+-driven multidrug efflux pump
MGAGQVFQNSFQMAGDTVMPLLITLVSLWVVGIPLAYVLTQFTGLGEFGVAWATVIAMMICGGAYVPYFLSDRWLRIKMFAQ